MARRGGRGPITVLPRRVEGLTPGRVHFLRKTTRPFPLSPPERPSVSYHTVLAEGSAKSHVQGNRRHAAGADRVRPVRLRGAGRGDRAKAGQEGGRAAVGRRRPDGRPR